MSTFHGTVGFVKMKRILRVVAGRALPPYLVVLAPHRQKRREPLWTLTALLLWTVLEALAEDEVSNMEATRGQQDEGTKRMMVASNMVAWWLPVAFDYFGNGRASRTARFSGISMIAVGACLRIACVRTLGKYFTGHVQVIAEQPVVISGAYRYVRHPSYVGLLLINLGSSITTRSIGAAVLTTMMTMMSIRRRVSVEEAELMRVNGPVYRSYVRQVPNRFVPVSGRTLSRLPGSQ